MWKSFTRGYHVLFMNPWSGLPRWFDSPPPDGPDYQRNQPDFPGYRESRLAMRNTARLAAEFDLARMTPRDELASTVFCLAEPGRVNITFLPGGGEVTLDLIAAQGRFRAT